MKEEGFFFMGVLVPCVLFFFLTSFYKYKKKEKLFQCLFYDLKGKIYKNFTRVI